MTKKQELILVIRKRFNRFDVEAPDELVNYSRNQLILINRQLTDARNASSIPDVKTIPFRKKRVQQITWRRLNVNGIKNHHQALKIIHSLSAPSKIPTYGYSLPAKTCITGSKLAKIQDSICHDCYALDGWYNFSWVQNALYKRLEAINHPKWVDAMVFKILQMSLKWFRWHDSGDLQGLDHLHKIVQVALRTPDTLHWLPTREYGIVRKYWEIHGGTPFYKLVPNMSLRLSATMFDKEPPLKLALKLGCQVSGVSSTDYNCPASKQNHNCENCRACWEQKNFEITYKKHK